MVLTDLLPEPPPWISFVERLQDGVPEELLRDLWDVTSPTQPWTTKSELKFKLDNVGSDADILEYGD